MCVAVTASAQAADSAAPVPRVLQDVTQARGFAMGGATTAVGYGTEGINANPAMLSMYRRYQVELGGAWDIPNGYGYGGVSIVDSATSEVAMGQSYHLITFMGPDKETGEIKRGVAHINQTAISYPIADWLHVGVSARYSLIYNAYQTNSITMGAGVAVRLFEVVILGFSGNNLIPVANELVNRFFTLSTSASFGLFTPSVELQMDFTAGHPRFAVATGIEWIAGEIVPIRAGFVWDQISNTKYVSGGLGLFLEGSGFDISYRHEIGGYNGRLIALTVKFQSQ